MYLGLWCGDEGLPFSFRHKIRSCRKALYTEHRILLYGRIPPQAWPVLIARYTLKNFMCSFYERVRTSINFLKQFFSNLVSF